MKILVTGASGFVGKQLCSELYKQGHMVVAAVRSANTYIEDSKTVIIGSIDNNTDWSVALQDIDIVIHLAARVHVMNEAAKNPLSEFRKVNIDGTLNLANQAVSANIKRFIFLSSIKVNGEQTNVDEPFTEEHVANPQDAYGVSKLEAEHGLLLIAQQTSMEIVIIRPPLIYGQGVKANFAQMMRAVKRGIPLPLGAIYNKRSFIYVENLVSFILKCMHHPLAANQVFLISDGCSLSTSELLKKCAIALEVNLMLLPIPQSFINGCAVILGKKNLMQRVSGNLEIDIAKACTLLEWSPPFTVEDGLKITARNL